MIFASRTARCWPMHTLCPALKGKKLQGGILLWSILFHLSGLNSKGLLQNYYLQWLVIILTVTFRPFFMGILPKQWSFKTYLTPNVGAGMRNLRPSFTTQSRQTHFFRRDSEIADEPTTYEIYFLILLMTSGCLERVQMRLLVRVEVVSVPARKKVPTSSISSFTVYFSSSSLVFNPSSVNILFLITQSMIPPLLYSFFQPSFSFLNFSISFLMVSSQKETNLVLLELTSLSIALKLYLQKLLPSIKAKTVRVRLEFIDSVFETYSQMSSPSILSFQSSPKKLLMTMLPNILENSIWNLTAITSLSKFSSFASRALKFCSAISEIAGMRLQINSWLKILLSIFFFFFQASPSLRNSPSPMMFLRAEKPGKFMSFWQYLSFVFWQYSVISQLSIRSIKISEPTFMSLTWHCVSSVLAV